MKPELWRSQPCKGSKPRGNAVGVRPDVDEATASDARRLVLLEGHRDRLRTVEQHEIPKGPGTAGRRVDLEIPPLFCDGNNRRESRSSVGEGEVRVNATAKESCTREPRLPKLRKVELVRRQDLPSAGEQLIESLGAR